jgi:hypothetical protein
MKRLLLIAMVALLPGSLLRAVFSDPPPVPWETNLSNWVCANDHSAKLGDNRDDTAAIQAAIDAVAAAGKTVVYLRGIGGGDIFVTDCSSRLEFRSPGQCLWARQFSF